MEVGGGGSEIMQPSLHCHHQIDTCIKMGSDESHFNVSLIVRDKSHKTVSTNNKFRRERRAEAESNRGPSAYQPTYRTVQARYQVLPIDISTPVPVKYRTGTDTIVEPGFAQ